MQDPSHSTLWSSLSFLTPKSLQSSTLCAVLLQEYMCLYTRTMSKAIHELMNNENVAASHSFAGIRGHFPIHEAVLDGRTCRSPTDLCRRTIEAMPKGTKVISAEAYGYSAWTITGNIATSLPDGTTKRYFLKVKTISFKTVTHVQTR